MGKHSDHPAALAQYNFENIHDAIQHFYSNFTVSEARLLLHRFYREWIGSDTASGLTGQECSQGLFFYEQLCVLVEASFRLQKKRIKKGKKQHHYIFKPKSFANEHPSPSAVQTGAA